MGRESRLKKQRKADPERPQRIQSMLESERQMRDGLEDVLKKGRELGDRAHYHKLDQDTAARVGKLLEEFKGLLGQWIDMLGRCCFANHQLRSECAALEDELARLQGRPPKPDPFARAAPMLDQLPPRQAAALQLMATLGNTPPKTGSPDTTEAFDKAKAFVEAMATKAAEVRREAQVMFEIGEEKVRRSWAERAEIDSYKATAEESFEKIEAPFPGCRKDLESQLAEHESLLERRQQLRQALGR